MRRGGQANQMEKDGYKKTPKERKREKGECCVEEKERRADWEGAECEARETEGGRRKGKDQEGEIVNGGKRSKSHKEKKRTAWLWK